MSVEKLAAVVKKAATVPELIYWKQHALFRMRQRSIRVADVLTAFQNGQIIELYHADKPFPSVLVNGKAPENRPLHIVVGINADTEEIHIITSYRPDSKKWDENFSARK